jgi:hypothetical protein
MVMEQAELELLLLLAAAGQGQGRAWPWLAEARPLAASLLPPATPPPQTPKLAMSLRSVGMKKDLGLE